MSAIKVPVGITSKNLVMMIATPEMPPGAMLLGSRKHATPVAKMTAPAVSVNISKSICLIFLFLIFNITDLRKISIIILPRSYEIINSKFKKSIEGWRKKVYNVIKEHFGGDHGEEKEEAKEN